MRKILCVGLLMALGLQDGRATNSWTAWILDGVNAATSAASQATNKTIAVTNTLVGTEAPPFTNITPKILSNMIKNYKAEKAIDQVRWWEVIGATQSYDYSLENDDKCYRTMMITGLTYYKYNQSIQPDPKNVHRSIMSQEKEFLMAKMNPAQFIDALMRNGYSDHALTNDKPASKPGGSFKRRWFMEKQSDFKRILIKNEDAGTFGMTVEVVCYLSKKSPSKNFIDLHLARTLSHTIGQDKNLLQTVDAQTFKKLLKLSEQDINVKNHIDNIKIDNPLEVIESHKASLVSEDKAQSMAPAFEEKKNKTPNALEAFLSNAQPPTPALSNTPSNGALLPAGSGLTDFENAGAHKVPEKTSTNNMIVSAESLAVTSISSTHKRSGKK